MLGNTEHYKERKLHVHPVKRVPSMSSIFDNNTIWLNYTDTGKIHATGWTAECVLWVW